MKNQSLIISFLLIISSIFVMYSSTSFFPSTYKRLYCLHPRSIQYSNFFSAPHLYSTGLYTLFLWTFTGSLTFKYFYFFLSFSLNFNDHASQSKREKNAKSAFSHQTCPKFWRGRVAPQLGEVWEMKRVKCETAS